MCKNQLNFVTMSGKLGFFSKQQLLRFYKAYVIPTIVCGILVYDNTSQSHITQIMKLQKITLRIILIKRRYESIKEIMDENRLLTVFGLYFFDLFKNVFMELQSDKKMVFCLRFTPKKVDHVPEAVKAVLN